MILPTDLHDRVAVVVGAGQTPGLNIGNGRATALVLARAGARVVAADRDLASAEETVKIIESEGGEAVAAHVDITSEEQIAAMVGETVDRWGRIDVLHNNVGVATQDAAVTEIGAEALSRLISINLVGMVLTCKHVVPVMRRQGSGAITNVASVAVIIDYPHVGYKVSKAGVVSLTEHLAIRHADAGIRANAILPGLMETPMAVEYFVGQGISREEILADRARRTPLKGRPGSAWDVANAALFLASDAAAFVTGTSLVVDGGQSLRVG
jgi:NAD(P)-dependent dehydrogenase (short-subunit alcohol dehydrogenase family)